MSCCIEAIAVQMWIILKLLAVLFVIGIGILCVWYLNRAGVV